MPEITTGGGAWIDYDRDGDLDLYVGNGRVSIAQSPIDPLDPFVLMRGLDQ